MLNIEANVTLRCNARCPSCDRHVCYFPERTDDMTLAQLEDFLAQAARQGNVGRVKLVGGEPTCWPVFREGYAMLVDALRAGVIGGLSVNTNCVAPRPEGLIEEPRVRWQMSRIGRKVHIPNCWAPVDLGLPWIPCSHPRRCGISLDNRGYLPCSPAISIARLFGMEDLYQKDLPTGPWGLDRLCPVCPYALPAEVRAAHAKPLAAFSPEERAPTKSWAAVLRLPAFPALVPREHVTLCLPKA